MTDHSLVTLDHLRLSLDRHASDVEQVIKENVCESLVVDKIMLALEAGKNGEVSLSEVEDAIKQVKDECGLPLDYSRHMFD